MSNTTDIDEIRSSIRFYSHLADTARVAKNNAEGRYREAQEWRDIYERIKTPFNLISNGLSYLDNEQYDTITNACQEMTDPPEDVLDAMHLKDTTKQMIENGIFDDTNATLSALIQKCDDLMTQYMTDIQSAESRYNYYMALYWQESAKL